MAIHTLAAKILIVFGLLAAAGIGTSAGIAAEPISFGVSIVLVIVGVAVLVRDGHQTSIETEV